MLEKNESMKKALEGTNLGGTVLPEVEGEPPFME